MIPRTFSRHLIFVSLLAFVALGSATPMRTDALPTHGIQRSVTTAYCSSELDGHAVYISKIFDVVSPTRVGGGISTGPLNFAFKNYLIEEYDFKSNAHYSAGCAVFLTLSLAEANRRQIISQAQQANKQIVEIKWNPGLIVAVDRGDSFDIGPRELPPSHTICAIGYQNTTYFSAVFDTIGSRVDPAWDNAFNNFLKKNYGAEGLANCTSMNTMREAARLLKDRVYGLRVNNHKAVETGWKYGAPLPLAVGTGTPMPNRPPKVVDDVEPPPVPVQRPTPAPPPAPASAPTQSTQDFATKEGPQVLAYCQNDRLLSKIFDCYRVQRSVYNYRMEHGTSEPLASLFKQEKVNLAEAIGTGLGQWVRDRASAQGLDNRVTNCIEQKFNVSFYEKPYVSKMNEIYAASVAACKP
ncbi:MAG TPA: hypothetical protein VGW76_21435 [Pyrinomonadaceae bacterium]|nr:hypothetical protein [Pyrinomonadaceae bacterium]